MASIDRLWSEHPRVRILREGGPEPEGRCVLYWMQRTQRGTANAALNLALALGNALGLPVLATFGLTAGYPGAHRRHYRFLVDALPEIAEQMARRGVPLVVRLGDPAEVVLRLAREVGPAAVVGDENPLRVGQEWRQKVAQGLKVPFRCVDGDVVVPTSHFPREEYAARTIRPKIHRLWHDYLKPIPNPSAKTRFAASRVPGGEALDPDGLLARLKVGGVPEVAGYRGGPAEAHRRLRVFLSGRLSGYATKRNEPVPYHTSELSAHLHFGHIGPLEIALAAIEAGAPEEDLDAFLEELVVRRELCVNFVARNPDYDRLAGCPEWALATLARHAADPRPHRYSREELEAGATHDPLWNAAQKEMLLTGRMHNYLRMYWAKKILEWSPDAGAAFETCRELNDTYFLDGRDPNGYAGIAWAIGGKHDRPWPERPIYGTVRSMMYDSTRRKFDSDGYIRAVAAAERDGPEALGSLTRTG